jgi:transcriptional regulator of acetoin/glycerol metabolism
MRALRAYAWPGNVRQLETALESAAIRADGDRIEAQHLPPEVRQGPDANGSAGERYRVGNDSGDELAVIMAALDEAGGSRLRAAEIMGMGRTTLWRKMKHYGIAISAEEGAHLEAEGN